MLWLQEREATKHLRVVRVATESNPADMSTKALGRSEVEEFCAEIGQKDPHERTLDTKLKKLREVKFADEMTETDVGMI